MQDIFNLFLEKKILNKIKSILNCSLFLCLFTCSFAAQAQTAVDSYIASMRDKLSKSDPIDHEFHGDVADFLAVSSNALSKVGYESYTYDKHDSVVLAIADYYRAEAERKFDSELYEEARKLYRSIYYREVDKIKGIDLEFRQLLKIQALWGIAQSYQDQGEFSKSAYHAIRAMQTYSLYGSNNLFERLLKNGHINSKHEEIIGDLLITYEKKLLELALWYEESSMYQKANVLLTEHEKLVSYSFFKQLSPQQCLVSKIYKVQFLYNTYRHKESRLLYNELKADIDYKYNKIPNKEVTKYLECVDNHKDISYGLELIKRIKKEQDLYIYQATSDYDQEKAWVHNQLIYSQILLKKFHHIEAKNVLNESLKVDIGVHPLTLDIYHAYAHIYEAEQKLDSAHYFYRQAVEYCNTYYKDQNENYIHYIKVWGALAEFHHKKDELDVAMSYYESIKNNCLHKLNIHHEKRAVVYKALGQIYQQKKEPKYYKKAMSYYRKLREITKTQISKNYPYLNEDYQKLFWEQKQVYFDLYLSYCTDYNKTEAKEIAEWWLELKELMLQRSKMVNAKRYELIDPIWEQKFLELDSLKAKAMEFHWVEHVDTELKNNQEQLNKKIGEIERELLGIAEEHRLKPHNDLSKVDWNDIHKQLAKDKSVAVDIIHFNYYRDGVATDSVRYIALVSSPEEKKPILIPLCFENDLEDILRYSIGGDGSYLSTSKDNKFLYEKLWTPIEPYLKNYKKVYLSLSGQTQRIAFDALHDTEQGKDLIDLYQISYFGNLKTSIYFSQKNTSFESKSVALFGGSLYNFSLEDNIAKGKPNDPNQDSLRRGKNGLPGTWPGLSGTQEEIKQIQKLLDNKSEWSILPFTGPDASERNIINLNGKASPNILHIATHGFSVEAFREDDYIPPSPGIRKKILLAKDPFWRCGLVLTGANITWTSNSSEAINHDNDGVLFAHEIAALSLGNTELVVLSACRTANGDLSSNTESTQGLQRAFRQAGAQKVLMTLSDINDKTSAEMMALFYKHCLKSSSYDEAFQKARKDFRKMHSDPELWAPFILVN